MDFSQIYRLSRSFSWVFVSLAKSLVEVHVDELVRSLVEVGEDHGGARDPVEAMWFGHTSCPVVGPILGVDHHRDVLDEPVSSWLRMSVR